MNDFRQWYEFCLNLIKPIFKVNLSIACPHLNGEWRTFEKNLRGFNINFYFLHLKKVISCYSLGLKNKRNTILFKHLNVQTNRKDKATWKLIIFRWTLLVAFNCKTTEKFMKCNQMKTTSYWLWAPPCPPPCWCPGSPAHSSLEQNCTPGNPSQFSLS